MPLIVFLVVAVPCVIWMIESISKDQEKKRQEEEEKYQERQVKIKEAKEAQERETRLAPIKKRYRASSEMATAFKRATSHISIMSYDSHFSTVECELKWDSEQIWLTQAHSGFDSHAVYSAFTEKYTVLLDQYADHLNVDADVFAEVLVEKLKAHYSSDVKISNRIEGPGYRISKANPRYIPDKTL